MNKELLGLIFLPAGVISMAAAALWQMYVVMTESYTLNRFKEDQHLNFPLLSDFNKEVCTAYHSIYAEFGYGMKGVAKRSAFVVDGEGILRYVEVLENAAEIPSFENIKTTLAAIEQ